MVPMETIRRSSAIFVLVVAAALPVHAGQVAQDRRTDFAFEAGAGYIDNLERAASGGESGLMTSAGAQFSVQRASRRLTAVLGGDLTYIRYPGEVYDEEILGNAQAQLRAAFVPERLEWVIDDSFGQARQDDDAAPTPENTENVNYLLTGPSLTLPMSSRWQLRASARYGRLDYQTSPYDSALYKGAFGLVRELASGAALSLDVESNRTRPEEQAGASNFRSEAATLGYSLQGARTGLQLDVGAQRLRQPGTSHSSALLRFSFLRKIGNISSLRIEAGREYRNNGDLLIIGGDLPIDPPIGSPDGEVISRTVESFKLDRASVNFGRSGRVTDINVYAEWFREGAVLSDLQDRERLFLGGSVSRRFGPRLEGNVAVWQARNGLGRAATSGHNEIAASLGLTWRISSRLYATLSGDYAQYTFLDVPNSVETRQAWLHIGFGEITVRRRGAAAVR